MNTYQFEMVVTALAVFLCMWIGLMTPPISLWWRISLRVVGSAAFAWLLMVVILANEVGV